ncbi:hypothetical protein CTAYLR_007744 [Chrysophaeum taylorii]|uniref:FHA domain-containing protein n=1 Tax=Chrysophaeum taylorii TaxID=2483200 RepID=A0AAD7XMC8_9STRA|nr:hypothetical protein CTAYLR_007744 [Chrysophaeum taylorii]
MKRRREDGTSRRLFVGNLSLETKAEGLRAAFERFGKVVDAHVPDDRGFGFVTLESPAEAEAAKAATVEVDGRRLRVSDARQSTRHVWGRPDLEDVEEEVSVEAAKPNFGLSGALAKDEATGNVYKGHVLKFTEPEDAAKPRQRWRIYVFKDDKIAETLYVHRQSAFLVGRIKEICDVLTMHPSCSGQHAVIQFRDRHLDEDGARPYVMDLESTNGTFLNGDRLDPARYVELKHKDVLTFASSSREYVIIKSDGS